MPVSSTNKHMGGRGLKAGQNKYERFSVTLPPHVVRALERYAEKKTLSRSEAIAEMVTRHEKVWPTEKK
jgi:hypothetical protein